jgi:hypothetical protein
MPGMDTVKVTIQYTAEDLQKAYNLHFKKMHPFRSKLVLILGGLLVLLGVFLAVLQSISGVITWMSWFFVIYGMLVVFYYFWKYNRMGKTAFRKLTEFHYPFTFTITEEGIQTVGKNVESKNSWEHYQSALVTQHFVILYPNKLRFVLLPKKYFSDEDFALLSGLVKEKIIKRG